MSRARGRGRGWIMVALLAVAAAAWMRARRATTAPPGAPTSSEPQFAPFTATAAPVAEPVVAPAPAAAWVAPVDGECPAGYPVKVAASGIFHVPGGRFYARTAPERCYRDPQSAITDGYRQAKA